MNYNFDKIINRKNTGSIKYDFVKEHGKPDGSLPFWVADMDFQLPPEILAGIHNAVSHGIFGYTEPLDDYFRAVTGWFQSRFGYRFSREEIVLAPGVVFSMAQIIRAFTEKGDGVILQTPVYYPFFHLIRSNGRQIAESPLLYSGGRYSMDFESLERQAVRPETKLLILCSPHNPVGRVWTREELARVHEICRRHGVLVVSDEIHCDFVWPGNQHTCYGLLDGNAVICTAPSKTFNLAGLQVSNLVVKNAALRRRLKDEISASGYSHLNVLGLAACKSAYENGGSWLAGLKEYIEGNIAFTKVFLRERLPKVKLVEPEGTYLLWLDFSAYSLPQSALDRRVAEGAGLWLDGGTMFGDDGENFQRINAACPRSLLAQALARLENEFKDG